jgi:predicted metal-binding protein
LQSGLSKTRESIFHSLQSQSCIVCKSCNYRRLRVLQNITRSQLESVCRGTAPVMW